MRRISCLLLLLLATSCSSPDPFQRVGTWQPNYSNDANLRLMVANPNDLVAGRGAPGTPGTEAAQPITRLFSGRRAPLPQISDSEIDSSNGGSAPPPPVAPASPQ